MSSILYSRIVRVLRWDEVERLLCLYGEENNISLGLCFSDQSKVREQIRRVE